MIAEPTAPFLRACRRLPTDYTPVWFMRQAGRYMPEYMALKEKYTMLERINTPTLAAEITMQPINAFNLDAAIIFSDILPPLIGMGLDLEFVGGVGPRLNKSIHSAQDVADLVTPPAAEIMGPTLEAIKLVTAELAPRGIPLIGFSGAPFTLASYAIEGGGSKNYLKAKSFMYNEPAAWDQLMNKLVAVQADYLLEQARAGAAALQVFDSWAGHALSKLDYVRYVRPYNTQLFQKLEKAGVPVINFSTGTSSYLAEVAACGGDVIGIDWQMPLDWAWQQIGHDKAIQGNLDPVALLAPWPELKARADDVLNRAAGRSGHIFNLGHGLFPSVPVDNVRRVIDYVHERTS
ncbi:MAG: uroporphyrinogen decarboxylase [Ardenticatenaceae bacterium]|nr:uroporphyrinogen decarboxylase [Ardenticatenaceae bacterium]MCB9444890.1 uroporphyrinogen decarboxylase [Ardenticatenaceae bacterium]